MAVVVQFTNDWTAGRMSQADYLMLYDAWVARRSVIVSGTTA